MGTNYYAIRKLPNSIKGKLCELFKNDLYDEAMSLFNDNYEKIHIGKQSYGWKFLFNYNNFKYYDLNRDSIDLFLRNNDILLYNEYNEPIDIDEFWEMVNKNNDKLDNKKYYANSPNISFILFEEMIPDNLKDKYDVECYEFYSDELRFSSSTEFS